MRLGAKAEVEAAKAAARVKAIFIVAIFGFDKNDEKVDGRESTKDMLGGRKLIQPPKI
jgi:hypothetical protein